MNLNEQEKIIKMFEDIFKMEDLDKAVKELKETGESLWEEYYGDEDE